jgi:hypothetical protein
MFPNWTFEPKRNVLCSSPLRTRLLSVTESVALSPGSGERHVIEYRAYFVGSDGHLAGFEPIICASDEEAIERAQQFAINQGVELWSGARLVATLEQRSTK